MGVDGGESGHGRRPAAPRMPPALVWHAHGTSISPPLVPLGPHQRPATARSAHGRGLPRQHQQRALAGLLARLRGQLFGAAEWLAHTRARARGVCLTHTSRPPSSPVVSFPHHYFCWADCSRWDSMGRDATG